MTQISSYYASVGVRIDNSALKDIQSYLNKIKSQLKSFQESVSKSSSLKIKMDLDRTGFSNKVRDVLKAVGNTSVLKVKNSSVNTMGLKSSLKSFSDKSSIRISNFRVNRSALNKVINEQPQQQQQNLKGTVLSATINNFRVNKAALNKSVRGVEIGAILLKHFRVDRKAISEAVNKALGANAGRTGSTSIRLGARLSRDSITAMREQIRQGLSNITIRPNVNARLSTTQRGGGSSGGTPSKGGWSPTAHVFGPRGMNPFITGGLIGSMMRFGMFAIPGMAGAWGLNALSTTGTKLENQRIMLAASSGDPETAQRNFEVVDRIGSRLGRRTSDMLPFYSQMYAGARGTELEAKLPTGFESFMEYASVMGLNGEQLKGSIRAISQAVAKGRIQSEEWRQQLSEHGVPEAMNILADVVTGGDRAKLEKMMEQGQVDVYKYLPLFFEEAGRRAQNVLPMFFESIQFEKGQVARASEDFARSFFASGGEKGITTFLQTVKTLFRSAQENAAILGDAFYRVSNGLQFLLLASKELTDWFKGLGDDRNIWNQWIGELKDNKWVDIVSSNFERLTTMFDPILDVIDETVKRYDTSYADIFTTFYDTLGYFSEVMLTVAEMIVNTLAGNFSGAKEALERQGARTRARDEAYAEAQRNPEMTDADRKALQKTLFENYLFLASQGKDSVPGDEFDTVRTGLKVIATGAGGVVGAKLGGPKGAIAGSVGASYASNLVTESLLDLLFPWRPYTDSTKPDSPAGIPSNIPQGPFAPVNYFPKPVITPPESAKIDATITVKSDGSLSPEAESGLVKGFMDILDNWWNSNSTGVTAGTPMTTQ